MTIDKKLNLFDRFLFYSYINNESNFSSIHLLFRGVIENDERYATGNELSDYGFGYLTRRCGSRICGKR